MFKLHKPHLSGSIHSGHFMVSRLDDDEEDDNNGAADDSSESERDIANSVEIDVNNPESVVEANNLEISYQVESPSAKDEHLTSWNDLDRPAKQSQKQHQYLTYYTNSYTSSSSSDTCENAHNLSSNNSRVTEHATGGGAGGSGTGVGSPSSLSMVAHSIGGSTTSVIGSDRRPLNLHHHRCGLLSSDRESPLGAVGVGSSTPEANKDSLARGFNTHLNHLHQHHHLQDQSQLLLQQQQQQQHRLHQQQLQHQHHLRLLHHHQQPHHHLHRHHLHQHHNFQLEQQQQQQHHHQQQQALQFHLSPEQLMLQQQQQHHHQQQQQHHHHQQQQDDQQQHHHHHHHHHHQHAVTIDTSLTKLLECMSLYYSSKLTSPKWKSFKGLKLRLKYKIRLNNLIWRAWFLQCIRGRRPPGCQFTAPVETDVHKKSETIVLEGKYWKRKEKAIVDEYKKWRIFHKQKSQMNCFRPVSIGNNIDQLMMDELVVIVFSLFL